MLSLEIKSVRHETDIIIGDYPFADRVKEEVISLMSKGCRSISNEYSNVKATLHTEWNWETENITFTNLKSYILNEIEKYYAQVTDYITKGTTIGKGSPSARFIY